jgi:Uma2 family endonuclease
MVEMWKDEGSNHDPYTFSLPAFEGEQIAMSTTTQAVESALGSGGDCYPPFRMSIDQYEKLVDSGVFTKRDKLQLINGRLVANVTKNPPHAVVTGRCRLALDKMIPPACHTREEKPVRLPPDSEPEPDVCVVRGVNLDYVKRHPGPGDVGLLVEVADSSLADDRKMWVTYRARGISVYWVVNIPGRQIEVYTGAGRPRVYKPGKSVPVVLDGVEVGRIAVDEILL